MALEEIGTAFGGKYKIYQDTNPGPVKMGYSGITRMAGDPPSWSIIQGVLDGTIERIKQYPADKPISRDELLGFLGMLRELTEPAPQGYFFCPYVPQDVPADHWSHKLEEKLKKQIEAGGPSYLELGGGKDGQ